MVFPIAQKFCVQCFEYSKRVNSLHLEGKLESEMTFIALRDSATEKALSELGAYHLGYSGEEQEKNNQAREAEELCVKCNYSKPKITNFLRKI